MRSEEMTHEQLKRYLDAQTNEIMIHKWIESEKEGKDIGFQQAAFDWISKFSSKFRDYWGDDSSSG